MKYKREQRFLGPDKLDQNLETAVGALALQTADLS